MKLFAIDPGRTTGLAWATIDRTWQVTGPGWTQLPTYDISSVSDILELIPAINPDVVIMENFITRTLAADDWPISIVSIIQWEFSRGNYWEGLWAGTLAIQQPAERSIINDVRLKRMELYQPGLPHANDAMRHLVVYSRKARINDQSPSK